MSQAEGGRIKESRRHQLEFWEAPSDSHLCSQTHNEHTPLSFAQNLRDHPCYEEDVLFELVKIFQVLLLDDSPHEGGHEAQRRHQQSQGAQRERAYNIHLH